MVAHRAAFYLFPLEPRCPFPQDYSSIVICFWVHYGPTTSLTHISEILYGQDDSIYDDTVAFLVRAQKKHPQVRIGIYVAEVANFII